MSPSVQPRLKHALPAVYAVAALRVLFPLAVLPLMAARLGPEEFGRLSQLLVWAALLSVLVEGGFMAAATRHAVLADAERRAALARQVFSARCVLSVLAAALALAIGLATAPGWQQAVLLAALACATGWPATWYLQATGQLHRFALVEGAVHAVWLAALFAAAHSIEAYLLMNAGALALLAVLGWRRVRADLPPPAALWSRADCRRGLALGGAMMPVSLAGAAYAYALPAVAALQMPRAELGLYYLADRWVRALLMAADPLTQLIYPRIVERFRRGARAALALAARWAAAGLVAGCLALAAGALLWPQIAPRLPAGVDAGALGAVLAVSAWLLPLLLGWKAIGLWMLGSARFDGAYRACMIAGALAGVGAVALLQVQQAVLLARIAVGVELLVIAVALVGIAWRLRWASTSTT
jgi:O-antigen/teichoic acid export membrane protein